MAPSVIRSLIVRAFERNMPPVAATIAMLEARSSPSDARLEATSARIWHLVRQRF